jgi:hypothetical protein
MLLPALRVSRKPHNLKGESDAYTTHDWRLHRSRDGGNGLGWLSSS